MANDLQPDPENIAHHVAADDYLVTMATTLTLLHETWLADTKELQALLRRNQERLITIERLRNSLLFTQRHYRLFKRPTGYHTE